MIRQWNRANAADEKSTMGLSIRAVLLVAAGLRVLASLISAWRLPDGIGFYMGDTDSYLEPAVSLVRYGRFGDPLDGSFEILRTPGYPLFLTPGIILGHVIATTIILQIILSCASVYLIFRIGVLLFRRREIALLGAFFSAIDPFSIVSANKLGTETLFVFLILLFLHYLLRYLNNRRWVHILCSSFCLSAAIYVRPIAYYLAPCITAALLTWAFLAASQRRRLLLHAGIFFLLAIVLIVPWQIRNMVRAAYPAFSAIQDFNLYEFNQAAVLAGTQGIPISEVQRNLGPRDSEQYFQIHPEQRNWPDGWRYRFMGRQGLKVLMEHPLLYARIHFSGMLVVLMSPTCTECLQLFGINEDIHRHLGADVIAREGLLSAAVTYWRERKVELRLAILFSLFLWPCLLLSLFGLAFFRPTTKTLLTGVLIVGIYFFILPGGPQASPRYRDPLMPIICIFAGQGWFTIADYFRREKMRALCE